MVISGEKSLHPFESRDTEIEEPEKERVTLLLEIPLTFGF
jgi:hypothetical protein